MIQKTEHKQGLVDGFKGRPTQSKTKEYLKGYEEGEALVGMARRICPSGVLPMPESEKF